MNNAIVITSLLNGDGNQNLLHFFVISIAFLSCCLYSSHFNESLKRKKLVCFTGASIWHTGSAGEWGLNLCVYHV